MNDLILKSRAEWEKRFEFFCKLQQEFRHVLVSATPSLMEEKRYDVLFAFESLLDAEVECAKVYRGMIKGDNHGRH